MRTSIEPLDRLRNVRAIDVGHKVDVELVVRVGLERLAHHQRAQVRTTCGCAVPNITTTTTTEHNVECVDSG